jgi:O-methyltransferase involved in polyketide biosynthesis
LPDVIDLRRRFFADPVLTQSSGPVRPPARRTMIAASLADEDWLDVVAELPGPCFFVADGVLPYVAPEDVAATLTRIAARFPGAFIAFDSTPWRMLQMQHQRAAKTGMPARWAWACDDPKSLEQHGLRLIESATITGPPPALRRTLPVRYRYLLPLAAPILGKSVMSLSLFRAA